MKAIPNKTIKEVINQYKNGYNYIEVYRCTLHGYGIPEEYDTKFTEEYDENELIIASSLITVKDEYNYYFPSIDFCDMYEDEDKILVIWIFKEPTFLGDNGDFGLIWSDKHNYWKMADRRI